jgi:galactokinase/mevalonate kinase-like predicted kinase
MWHQRRCLRVGISRSEVEAIQSIAIRIAAYGGKHLGNIGSVYDIKDAQRADIGLP